MPLAVKLWLQTPSATPAAVVTAPPCKLVKHPAAKVPAILGVPVCHLLVAPRGRAVALVSADETALVRPGFVAIGTSPGPAFGLATSADNASLEATPGRARITAAVTLDGMTGSQNIYINVFDGHGRLTHWRAYHPVNLP